ncbi:hypothetical protein M0804_010691 [Polistes exclamans]|nr:hypothetical protein M0804_010691 [Polistes exclamans]
MELSSDRTWPRTMFSLLCFVLLFVGAVSANGTLEKLHEVTILAGSGASRKAIGIFELAFRIIVTGTYIYDSSRFTTSSRMLPTIVNAFRKCYNETELMGYVKMIQLDDGHL